MKRISIPALILLFVLLMLLPALAQDSDPTEIPEGCDPTAPTSAIDAYIAALERGDFLAITDALRQLNVVTRSTNIACSGYRFTSGESGLQAVIGPIDLSSGIWVAEVTTTRAFIANVNVVGGMCDPAFNLFNILSRTATNGASAVIESNNCSMVLEISNANEPWVLTFEQLMVADEIPPEQPTPRPEATTEATDEAEQDE